MITAPDGSTATYDTTKTRRAYADPAVCDNCECPGCENYRIAWTISVLPPDLVAACDEIGIDPSKGFETTAVSWEDGLIEYVGMYPFYGEVSNGTPSAKASWSFSPSTTGTAGFDDGLVSINFSVRLPWLSSKPNPYVDAT